MEEKSFLRAIAADPSDDLPRLVYADWLEERDDPRAAFLRTEVSLARSGLTAEARAELLEHRITIDPAWWSQVARSATFPPVIFRCAICQLPLTGPLRLLADAVWLGEGDSKPLVPAGFFWKSDGNAWNGTAGHYCVNLADLRNVKPHPDNRRRNGCCGMDGCDGMNTVCGNGHEVGTECSDCWMPHFFHLAPTAVEVLQV